MGRLRNVEYSKKQRYMKKTTISLLLTAAVILFAACAGQGGQARPGKAGKKTIMTPASTGDPYEILVVASSADLQNEAGKAVIDVLSDDIPGLPQSESAFKVSKVTDDKYYKTLRFCRNILMVKTDPQMYSMAKMKYQRNVYATPQMVMTVQAPDAKSLAEFVNANAETIVDFFTKAEMNNEIERLRKKHSLYIQENVKEMFNCDVWVPQELTKTKKGKDFFWASTSNGDKDLNFIVYSFPYRDLNTFTEEYFFDKRDSILGANIPGPREGQWMQTARPYVKVTDSQLRGRYAQMARGLWEMKDYDMGGPFVSISRVDEQNQKVVVAEAFVYAPGHNKRNIMRRIEAAIYTLQLPDEIDERRFSYAIEEVTVQPED